MSIVISDYYANMELHRFVPASVA